MLVYRDQIIGRGHNRRMQRGSAILHGEMDALENDARLPADTRLWAALQRVSGGTWGGCVYDVEKIVATLDVGEKALGEK